MLKTYQFIGLYYIQAGIRLRIKFIYLSLHALLKLADSSAEKSDRLSVDRQKFLSGRFVGPTCRPTKIRQR